MWRFSVTYFNCITLYFWISILANTQVKGALDKKVSLLYDKSDEWHQHNVRFAIPNNGELDCEKSDDFYICEEPLYTVPLESNKTCNYRSQNYHEQVYRWVAGRGCLLYTPDFLYINGTNTINLNAFCLYGNLFAPCLEMIKTDGSCGCYPFDPGLEDVANAVREALIPAVHGRWERCFYAAVDCCSHYMIGDESDATQCSATFDGWTCWQAAEAGSVVNEVCSEFAYSNVGPSCNHYSSKECYANSTWELQTDYSTCSITARLLRRYRFHIGMLSFSIVSCLPAVLIFFFYKRLRITRVILHRNLLVAIILRNVLLIVSRSEIYIDELTNAGDTAMSTHSVACRVLAIAERVTANAVFVCMLVEGLYMHSLIVAVFKQKFNLHLLYVIGAAIAIVPVVGWATVMAIHNDHSCWLVYTVDNIQWILDAPRIAILIINTILFANVLRVLLTKIRNTENAKQLSAAKATLFLMPIFGTQFLLTALRPNTSNCTGEQIYYYFTYSIEGLQGFIVALIYCYINKEVQMLLKATYKKTENAVMDRVRRPSSAPRPSDVNSNRRMTYSTGLPSIDEDYVGGSNAIRSEIHRAEIISIPNSERATVLEPIYETIQIGNTNEGYESTERSDLDNDSGIIPNRDYKIEEYYGFTNASSVSLEPKECIRYTATPTTKTIKIDGQKIYETDPYSLSSNGEMDKDMIADMDKEMTSYDVPKVFEVTDGNLTQANIKSGNDEINPNLLDDILEYMAGYDDVKLDPNVLSPNRKEEDKIAFVDF